MVILSTPPPQIKKPEPLSEGKSIYRMRAKKKLIKMYFDRQIIF